MTQADSLDLGFPFPDTHREIRALTETGMDEAQAEAVVYASFRAAAAASIAEAARQSAANDLKFQEVLHAIEDVKKDVESVKKDVEDVEKNVAKDIEGVRKELDAKLANRLLALGLGQAALILGAAGAVIAVIVNTG